MQTSTRSRDTGASFAARRGHLPQLSISDESHHVTEAIGYMYGDDPELDARSQSPYSNHHPTSQHQAALNGAYADQEIAQRRRSIPRKQLPPMHSRDSSNESDSISAAHPNGVSQASPPQAHSWDHRNHSHSPPSTSRERSPSETATSHFPLNDIDYESSPAAVAQELSNLQALRRMSMSVGATDDPDLPQLSAAGMPNAPSSHSSEDDASRLFWVPARLHPELAPKEFKSFLDSKAEQIRRRSGELSAFASPSSSRSSSLSIESASTASSLRRKKSMLSRQIDSSVGYQDGADRLERKKSQSRRGVPLDPNLQELESLVANASALPATPPIDIPATDQTADIILPSVPGSSLKRSTRTTYRRGGSVKGKSADRGTYAQRAARRAATGSPSGSRPETPESTMPPMPAIPSFASMDLSNLAETLKDPSGSKTGPTNFSRPAGREPSPPSSGIGSTAPSNFESIFSDDDPTRRTSTSSMPELRKVPVGSKSPPRSSSSYERRPVPQIVEVPPPEETAPHNQPPRTSSMQSTAPPVQPPIRHPERVSSREDRIKNPSPQRPPLPSKQAMPSVTSIPPSRGSNMPPQTRPSQSLDQPSPLPGNDTNTSNLSYIPTLTVDKRADHKKKEEPKKSGWSWGSLVGKQDGDKEKSEKPKAKISKPPQQHDNTRLDVLQTSIEGSGKGRESIVLDRDNLKLEEERKKESQRKSSGGEAKKEKESLFSSIFGGKKSKAEKEDKSKKYRDRGLSPEPPYRELRPDIDYNWTRFSILEERAIYRMAHIKLANPRRALYSQVLLSNFMYSYLAKVQQMHPQMNLPTSAKQQRKQESKSQQPDEFTQYQRYQQQQQEEQQQPVEQQYEEAAGDDYDANGQRPTSRGSKHSVQSNGSSSSYGGGYNNQYPSNNQQQGQPPRSQLDDDDDDMW